MKPLKLTMSAFGPFSATEEVDFTRLGESPLFLINGPTGAGKTSLLDAMCYALYGKTTGDEREASQMRCDSAKDTVLTEVIFEFSLGDRRYRIRRVPEQTRQKSVGEGTTSQKTEAQLYRLEGDDGEKETLIVAKKVKEATDEIKRLTGLHVDQFRQVMVLPQGKFRQLLMADSHEREKIFSQLFQTHRYRHIEERLKAQAATIRQNVREQRDIKRGILENSELDDDTDITELIAEATKELQAATNLKQELAQANTKATQALETARNQQVDFAALAELREVETGLNQQKHSIEQHKEMLGLAQQAEQFSSILNKFDERKQELNIAQDQFKAAESEAESAQLELDKCLEQHNTLGDIKRSLTQQQRKLELMEGLKPQLEQLSALRQEVASVLSSTDTAQTAVDTAEQQLKMLGEQQQSTQLKVTELKQQLEDVPDVLHVQHELSGVVNLYQQWNNKSSDWHAAQAQLTQNASRGKELADAHKALQERANRMQLSWHQGQAAILAAELQQGQACPVCGSHEHPNPAQGSEALPCEADLQQAGLAEEQARLALETARVNYAALQQKNDEMQLQADELKTRLGEAASLPLAELEHQLSVVTAKLNHLETVKVEYAQLELASSDHLKAIDKQMRLVEQAKTEQQTLGMTLSSLKGKLEAAEQQVPAEYTDITVLNDAINGTLTQKNSIEQQIVQIEQHYQSAGQRCSAALAAVQAKQQRLSEADTIVAQTQETLDEQLSSSVFVSVEAVQQAQLTPEDFTSLKQSVEAYDLQYQENQVRIQQLQQKLKDKPEPEISSYEDALHKANESYQTAESDWQNKQSRYDRLEQTRTLLQEADERRGALDQEYAVIGTLADVANGQTGNKISLQRFVLTVLLDDVLLVAGEHLKLMSKGRYRLHRKQDKAKGGKASGLELEVEDSYTSKSRPIATLSGGESFMAALAMALGLSDVVQAHAGGIKLDTLFIDEGFGSLDQESLDLAIRTLIDLQSAGRMVGVISHVSELKEQIGLRLDIHKTPHGSKTELVLP